MVMLVVCCLHGLFLFSDREDANRSSERFTGVYPTTSDGFRPPNREEQKQIGCPSLVRDTVE